LWYTQYSTGKWQLFRQVYQGGNNCFHMAGRSLSGLFLEVTPHVHGVGNAPALFSCEGVVDVSWASGLHLGLAHTRAPSECSVLRSCGQLREISVLLPLVVHPLIRQTFKATFECPNRRFWRALRPANSPGGLPLWQRRPPHPIGLGLGLGLGGLNRGPRSAESTVGRFCLTASLYCWGSLVRSAHHYHNPNTRGPACSRQLPATWLVALLPTVDIVA